VRVLNVTVDFDEDKECFEIQTTMGDVMFMDKVISQYREVDRRDVVVKEIMELMKGRLNNMNLQEIIGP